MYYYNSGELAGRKDGASNDKHMGSKEGGGHYRVVTKRNPDSAEGGVALTRGVSPRAT